MKYSTNQFKQGMKLLIEGEPCSVLSYEFHKPGKGQAVMRTKLYNLRTQKVWERTFKSGESVESADIIEKDFQFLYSEGENYVFMDQSTYEQVEVNSEQLGEIKHWLDGEEECKILFWDGAIPVAIADGTRCGACASRTAASSATAVVTLPYPAAAQARRVLASLRRGGDTHSCQWL